MKKVIVCTSINSPTEAVHRYDMLKDWTLVVIGDLKTPPNYQLDRGIYLSPEDQNNLSYELSHRIGWNKVERRQIGLLFAYNELHADIVATVDDDNIPEPNWGNTIHLSQAITVDEYQVQECAFDPLSITNHSELWHRGFPHELLPSRHRNTSSKVDTIFDIQANLWNGEADIDAKCRMQFPEMNCSFDKNIMPYTSNVVSPFNSQNTLISRKALPFYFLPPESSERGRVSDIWAGYHVQASGFRVLYCEANVDHERNHHDNAIDLADEQALYDRSLNMVTDIIQGDYDHRHYWSDNDCDLYNIYQSLLR